MYQMNTFDTREVHKSVNTATRVVKWFQFQDFNGNDNA